MNQHKASIGASVQLDSNGWTRHGHRIPGRPQTGEPPAVSRCGGPSICQECFYDTRRDAYDPAGKYPGTTLTNEQHRALLVVTGALDDSAAAALLRGDAVGAKYLARLWQALHSLIEIEGATK